MIHIDLFSGIGGFAYAIDQVFHEEEIQHTFVENDSFCKAVLKKHWPEAEYHSDVKKYRPTGTAFIVTGGFPCQPFSKAGKQKGTDDDRWLWPEMYRIIRQQQPSWVVAENVTGIINLALEKVLSDLEAANYTHQTFIIPACAVGAPHQRDRVWIVAHSNSERKSNVTLGKGKKLEQRSFIDADTVRVGLKRGVKKTTSKQRSLQRTTERIFEEWRGGWNISEPAVLRVDDGVSRRLDRIRSLGNSIVPQVAMEILKVIKEIEKNAPEQVRGNGGGD